MELTGTRVVLREFTREHLQNASYYRWLRDPEIIAFLNRIEYFLPLAFTEVERYVETLWSSGKDCFFAIHAKDSNEFIGTQRIGHIDWRSSVAELGVMIGERNFWGKGYATDSINVARDFAFNRLSLRRLVGGTPANNIAMCKCFLRLGFREEGRLRKQLLVNGEHQDHVLFGLLREDMTQLT